MVSVDGLRTAEVARRLEISEQRVRQLATGGQLPYVATPYGRVFDPAAVQRLASERAARRAGSSGEAA